MTLLCLHDALLAVRAIIQVIAMQEFSGSVRGINHRLGRFDFPFFVRLNQNKGNNGAVHLMQGYVSSGITFTCHAQQGKMPPKSMELRCIVLMFHH